MAPLTKEQRKKKFIEEHPNFDDTTKQVALPDVIVTPTNASEVLVGAVNQVISIYNKIAASITDADIKKMKPNEKILALQKLSYLHTATKNSKLTKNNLNFIKINTDKSSAVDLEKALVDFNRDDNDGDDK